MKVSLRHTVLRFINGVMMSALLCAAMATAQAAPVGMAANVVGNPQVKSGGGWKPLRVLQKLSSGDAVRCASGQSAVIVLFESGTRYQVGASSTATIGSTAVSGARQLGGGQPKSARVAKTLGFGRAGAIMFRPPPSFRRLQLENVGTPDPKKPPAHDWLDEDKRSWKMIPIEGAVSYVFSLIHPRDFVLMSTRIQAGDGSSIEVTLPTDLKLQPKQQYVWRLHGFRDDGKPITRQHWGITTVLTAEDKALLIEDEKALLNGEDLPDDEVQLALLVETYRKHGILQNALELLEHPKLSAQPGYDETRAEIVEPAGPYAQMLVTLKKDE